MDSGSISIAGISGACLVLWWILHRGIRYTIIHPIPIVGLAYFIWFGNGKEGTGHELYVDLLITGSMFLYCYIAMAVGKSLRRRRGFRQAVTGLSDIYIADDKLWFRPKKELSTEMLFAVAIGLSCLVIAYLATLSQYYPSFEAMMLRLRVHSPDRPLPLWLGSGEKLVTAALLGVMAIVTVNSIMFAKKTSFLVLMYFLLLYLVIVVPTGSTGHIVMAIFMISISALVCGRKWNLNNAGGRTVAMMIALSLVPLAPALLYVRSTNFNSIEEFKIDLVGAMWSDGGRSFEGAKDYRDGMAAEVGRVVEEFSDGRYMWLHTPYTLLVNVVPRSIWPEKPIAFGRLAATGTLRDPSAALSISSNVSFAAGVAGEGYANGGIVGIIYICVLVGSIAAVATAAFEICIASGNYWLLGFGLLLRQIPLGYVRGDVLGATAAFVYPAIFVWGVVRAVQYFGTKNGGKIGQRRRRTGMTGKIGRGLYGVDW